MGIDMKIEFCSHFVLQLQPVFEEYDYDDESMESEEEFAVEPQIQVEVRQFNHYSIIMKRGSVVV